MEIERSEEAAFVFEHGADAGVVGVAGADDGAIDEPRAFVFGDILIGLAADEDLVERDLQGWEAFTQDLEHFDDLAGVVESRLGVDPQQHAGQFAFVEFRVFLEHGGKVFERLGILAIVEVALAEG